MRRYVAWRSDRAARAAARWWSAGTALAQEFEKVEGRPREEIPAVPFVAVAYGIIWLAILVLRVHRRPGSGARRRGDRRPEAQSGSSADPRP